jgi:hypothetical protein
MDSLGGIRSPNRPARSKSLCWLRYLGALLFWRSKERSGSKVKAQQYFSTLSHKRHNFLKKLLNTKCVLISLTTFEAFLILRRTEQGMIKMCISLHVKYPLILPDFLLELEFSQQTFEKFSNIKFHENPFSGSRVVPCGQRDWDGQTDIPIFFTYVINVESVITTQSVSSKSTVISFTYGDNLGRWMTDTCCTWLVRVMTRQLLQ